MSYQVLARKWRPRSFEAMVGQDSVLQALVYGLEHQRLHHAYLFSGTRGVGKTTIARIFAKCLNCEQGVNARPCGNCSTCRAIDAGHYADLIEIDAASRTKVEDIREILDNVPYAPAQGRYKVYLIDEVHMLSAHSFNALLKTLEEPPDHVKFLLATTDPQKLPVTILSRCLQFNLKRLTIEQISQHLQYIVHQENIPAEPSALLLIARAAAGSIRDALTLLDQAIAEGRGQVTCEGIHRLLGSLGIESVVSLLNAIVDGNARRLFAEMVKIDEWAPDYTLVLTDIIRLLQRISITQVAPDAVSVDEFDRSVLLRFAEQMQPDDVQLFYQIALMGQRDLSLVPEPKDGFEMILLRMLSFAPASLAQGDTKPSPQGLPATPLSVPIPKQIIPSVRSQSSAVTTPIIITDDKPIMSNLDFHLDWLAIVPKLALVGVTKMLAAHCMLLAWDGAEMTLALSPNQAPMLNKPQEQRLKDAISAYLQRAIRLKIVIQELQGETFATQEQALKEKVHNNAVKAVTEDIHVQALINTFGATIENIEWNDSTVEDKR